MRKAILLYFKGLLMGAADIVPGVSGGTMALITGIYKELIESIDQLNFKQLLVLRKEGFVAFWQSVNGPFLLPLFLGIASGILFLSGGITYLLEHQPILLWSFFFGLILASIYTLINQFALKTTTHYALLFTGFMIAYSITQLSPAGTSNNLLYLFFSSMIAIIAMILPGISGAFIFILLGVYEEVLATVKGVIAVLLGFDLVNFKTIYTKVIIIGLGIVVGLKLFSRLLTWLFNHRKEATLSVLIGFMIGALPKIWPWKIEEKNGEQIIFTNTNPLQFEGDPQLGMAIALVVLGAAALILLERFALKK
jgi:putative membrane protein